jgi:hypothetical protein
LTRGCEDAETYTPVVQSSHPTDAHVSLALSLKGLIIFPRLGA